MSMRIPKIGIVGFGRAGELLFRIFDHKPIIYDRRKIKKSQVTDLHTLVKTAGIIFLAVPDDKIKSVAEKIVDLKINLKSKYLYHLSGINTSELLNSLKIHGAEVGALHPAISIADIDWIVENLDKFIWTIEGSDLAREKIIDIMSRKQIEVFPISAEAKLPYHLGCVFLSNLPVFNPEYGGIILRETRLPDRIINRIANGLLNSLQHNINQVGGDKVITGPLIRGDKSTIEKHLKFLEDEPEIYEWYKKKGLRIAKKLNNKQLIKLLSR